MDRDLPLAHQSARNPGRAFDVGPDGARVLALSAGNLREIIRSYGPMAAKFLHYAARGLCQKLLERSMIPRAEPAGVSPS